MFKWSVALLIITLMIVISGCGLSEDTAAKVGSETISKEDFTKALKQRFPKQENFNEIDKQEKMKILDKLIDEKLKVNAANDNDEVIEDEAFQEEYNQRKSRMLGNKYFEKIIVDKLLPEDMLREHYEKQSHEVKASHVLIGYKGLQRSKATRSKNEAEALAKDIVKRAKSGESFDAMAAKYSEDPSAKSNKGDLGYFTWGRMVGPFQETAFSLNPGEISDPVLTQFGYHVIKVVDKRANANFKSGDYDKQVTNIKRSLYQTKHVEGRQMWDEHVEQLKAEKSFEVNTENMNQALAAIKTKIDSGQFAANNFSDDEKGIVLAKWDDDEITLDNVFKLFGANLAREVNRFKNENQFKQNIDNVAMQKIITAEAEKQGYAEEKEIRDQLESFKRQRLLSLVNKKEVNDKVTIEDTEVKTYYDENAKEFMSQEEILIWEIFLDDEKQAKSVLAKAKAGQNFERLAERYSKDKYYAKKKGKLGYKRKNSRGPVSKTAFEIGENQISGPVKYKKGWAVIKTGDLKPATVQNFETVKAKVKSKLRARKIRDRKQEWEEELKNRYSVKVNDELVETI